MDDDKYKSLVESISDTGFWAHLLDTPIKPETPYIPTSYDRLIDIFARILSKFNFAKEVAIEICELNGYFDEEGKLW